MRRFLIGGSYLGAVAAGGVASAQLWLHAFSTDERSAIRELALPGTQERSVPALVEPARPSIAKPNASPSPFAGFTPIFASPGPSSPVAGVPGGAPGGGGESPSPGSPVPGPPVPGPPVPGQPAGGGGSTPSAPATAAVQVTASAAPPA